ncbi:MAG: FGGY family carbohydrate kinase [Acutalibacter sp.]
MMVGKYILSIDQGTTSSRAVLFDAFGGVAGMGQREFPQIYPQPGYVGDAVQVCKPRCTPRQAMEQRAYAPPSRPSITFSGDHRGLGRRNGHPVCNAMVVVPPHARSERLPPPGGAVHQDTTGLLIDPYFSGTKMKWILENVPAARDLAKKGRLRFGTIDTWLVYSLTDGAAYATDVTNASRTMLFDIHKLRWDDTLLQELGIPRSALPRVCESGEIVGMCSADVLGEEIPIAGIAGDQHAALFGQCCFAEGMAKNTYGTGCFVLMNTGSKPVASQAGLLTTIAWKLNGRTTYALEGSAFNAGSAIQWLRDELGLIKTPQEADQLAETVEDAGGVSFVPAFTGLGAPYWDMYARGALLGVTRGTTRAHLCRAVLESIALESADLVEAMKRESGVAISELRADGGASRSRFLMQYQADILNTRVCRPQCLETTALGSAMMAGLTVGLWDSLEELSSLWRESAGFQPDYPQEKREKDLARWHEGVQRSMGWAKTDG